MIEIPEGLDNAQLWAIVVGFITPIALNFIINAGWKNWVKAVIAFGFSAVVGVITALLAGAYTGLDVVSTILLTLVVAITSYQLFWKQIAPNMQRGSRKANQEKAQAAVDQIVSIAKPVAAAKAQEVVQNLPVATAVELQPGAIVIQNADQEPPAVG